MKEFRLTICLLATIALATVIVWALQLPEQEESSGEGEEGYDLSAVASFCQGFVEEAVDDLEGWPVEDFVYANSDSLVIENPAASSLPNTAAWVCVRSELDLPQSLISEIEHTTTMQGNQSTGFNGYRFSWSFNEGLTVVVEPDSVRG